MEKMVEAEDEINLYELFQVIWKRKILIIAIFFVSVLSAGIISFYLPPVYSISSIIKPGLLKKGNDGKNVYIDSPGNISVAIGSGSFDAEIIQSLKLDPEMYGGKFGFDTKMPKKSDFINISYNSDDPEFGKRIVGELLSQLDHVYSEKSELQKEKLDKSIQLLKNNILNIKNQKTTIKNEKDRVLNSKKTILNDKKKISGNIKLTEKKLGLLKESAKYRLQQRIEVEKNTKIIINERNNILKDSKKRDAVALLLYSNTIQQNLGYIDRRNSEIDKNRLEQEIVLNNVGMMEIQLKDKDTELNNLDIKLKDKDVELQNLDIKVMNIEQEIEKLEIDKKEVESIRIIQQPTSSFHPVKPKKKQIVVLAGIIGLMASIFLAFFMEFIENNKSQWEKSKG